MSIETMTKLATYTVGAGGISSYTFSNIPQNYTDLVIVGSVRTNRSGTDEDGMAMIINGLTTGYTYRGFIGNGASASSINTAFEQPWFTRVPGNTATGGVFGSFRVTIPRYSEYTQKSYSVDGVQENNTTTGYLNLLAITNTTTLPVTSLEFRSATGATMQQHSTITLYGIKNARTSIGNAIKASGGQISFDGTYVSHTFNSSGTFIPFDNFLVDYLVIAGGGGGGPADNSTGTNGNRSGGGGAGGYRTSVGTSGGGAPAEPSIFVSSSTSYAITVGAGGSGSASAPTSGSNSIFSSITSIGGGRGGGLSDPPAWYAAGNGGSGGGGGEGVTEAGSGTAGQGYAGGAAIGDQGSGAGGGGAGSAGANGLTSVGGNGGSGVVSNITGWSVARAGGGGGSSPTTQGQGGLGGGGSASQTLTGESGRVNTGSGGGSGSRNGGSGASGVVIIRYKP
jgi:hypothetical protein